MGEVLCIWALNCNRLPITYNYFDIKFFQVKIKKLLVSVAEFLLNSVAEFLQFSTSVVSFIYVVNCIGYFVTFNVTKRLLLVNRIQM